MFEYSLSFLLTSANRGCCWLLNLSEISETQPGLKSFHGQIPVPVTKPYKHIGRSFIPNWVLMQDRDLKKNLQANQRTKDKPNKLSRQSKHRPKSSSIYYYLLSFFHYLFPVSSFIFKNQFLQSYIKCWY